MKRKVMLSIIIMILCLQLFAVKDYGSPQRGEIVYCDALPNQIMFWLACGHNGIYHGTSALHPDGGVWDVHPDNNDGDYVIHLKAFCDFWDDNPFMVDMAEYKGSNHHEWNWNSELLFPVIETWTLGNSQYNATDKGTLEIKNVKCKIENVK